MKDFSTDSDLRSEYYRDHTIAVDLLEIKLLDLNGNDDSLYYCTGGADLELTSPTSGTVTYLAQGDFMGFSALNEDFDVKVGKFSVYLSGLNQTLTNKIVSYEIEGKRVTLYKAFLNFGSTGTDPLSVVSDPILMFDGVIYNFAVSETNKSCQINLDCSSLFADFERTNGRKTNNWSNWLFQGSNKDLSMEKAGYVGQTEFKWGRK